MPRQASVDTDYEQFKQTFINENPGLYSAMLHYTDHILPLINTKDSRTIVSEHTGISRKRLKEIYRAPFTITFVETHAILQFSNKQVIVRNRPGAGVPV